MSHFAAFRAALPWFALSAFAFAMASLPSTQKTFRCVCCGMTLPDSEEYGYFSRAQKGWQEGPWCKGDMLKLYDREYHA